MKKCGAIDRRSLLPLAVGGVAGLALPAGLSAVAEPVGKAPSSLRIQNSALLLARRGTRRPMCSGFATPARIATQYICMASCFGHFVRTSARCPLIGPAPSFSTRKKRSTSALLRTTPATGRFIAARSSTKTGLAGFVRVSWANAADRNYLRCFVRSDRAANRSSARKAQQAVSCGRIRG